MFLPCESPGKIVRFTVYFFILQLITVACSAKAESVIPQKLGIYVGSFIFGAWHVVLHGQTLTCTQEQYGREDQNGLPVTPSLEQWRGFRQAMDKLAVWRWQRVYPILLTLPTARSGKSTLFMPTKP